jgi:hypothetical protein
MIIVNGSLCVENKTGGGLDDADGYPVEPTVTWSEPVPCLIVPASLNYLAKSQSESDYVDASYTVLIEMQEFKAERVRLTNWQGDLGEFSVIRIEPLPTVDVVKIVV